MKFLLLLSFLLSYSLYCWLLKDTNNLDGGGGVVTASIIPPDTTLPIMSNKIALKKRIHPIHL